MPSRRHLEAELVETSQRLHHAGWVANHDGNVTAKLECDSFLATPTSISKAAVTRGNLIVVDGAGKLKSGNGKPFSELAIHLYIYRQRPDVRAVLHAHPPTATGFAVAGIAVRTTLLAESVVSLGASIPMVPYAMPKSPEWTGALGPHLEDADALLLEHHGVITVGPDLETAYLRMELVEHLAKIQLAAHQAGMVRQIPEEDVQRLLAARTKAGLGKAARAGEKDPEKQSQDVRTIVAQELGRALESS